MTTIPTTEETCVPPPLLRRNSNNNNNNNNKNKNNKSNTTNTINIIKSRRRFDNNNRKNQTKINYLVVVGVLVVLVISSNTITNTNTNTNSSFMKGCQSFSSLFYHHHSRRCRYYWRTDHYYQQLKRHSIFTTTKSTTTSSSNFLGRQIINKKNNNNRIRMSSSESESMNNNNNKSNDNDNDNKKKKKNLVIVLAGPTATGKSDVAAVLCSKLKGIIISADSVQAYKGVQIGANKPTQDELERTPHLLIDVADHNDNYNAAEWREDAILAINSLLCKNTDDDDVGFNDDDDDDDPEDSTASTQQKQKRQKQILNEIMEARIQKGYTKDDEPILPVVCGGTMMYIQWLVHGIPDVMKPTPTAVSEATQIITKFQNSNNNFKGAIEYVSNFGAIYENRISKFCGEDWYRLRRTLEVALTVQQQQQQQQQQQDSNKHNNNNKQLIEEALYTGERQSGLLDSTSSSSSSSNDYYDVRCFFLCPSDRMEHTKIVDERCEQMIIRGLLKETAKLSLENKFPDMASRAIGYRQALDYLLNDKTLLCSPTTTNSHNEGFTSFLNEFTTATRRYAKKQMSWFRKDPNFMFVSMNTSSQKIEKEKRIEDAAKQIIDYCNMSSEEFQYQLTSNESESTKCKTINEKQGSKMKFYQFERRHLIEGTQQLDDAINEAIKYGRQMQMQNQKQQQQQQGQVEIIEQQQQQQQMDDDTSSSSSRKRKAEAENKT